MFDAKGQRALLVGLALGLWACGTAGTADVDAADVNAGDVAADVGAGDAVTGPAIVPDSTNPAPTQAGTLYALQFVVIDAAGAPVPGATVTVKPGWGAGKVAAGSVTASAAGVIQVAWTTGELPILQTVVLESTSGPKLTLQADIVRSKPLTPSVFGMVDAYLTGQGSTESTEDVAIAPDGTWAVMGVADHLLRVNPAGDVTEWVLQGNIGKPLGLMFDAQGLLWVADAREHALKTVNLAGQVTSVLTEIDGKAMIQPNDLFVDPAGRVWLTDPCRGILLRYDPKTKSALQLASFDPLTQGGPNGIAVSPDGKQVYVTTENTAVTCAKGGPPFDLKLGSLWRAPMADGALAFQAVAEGVGIFGDGCIFDELGNLYATFDLFETGDSIFLKSTQVLVVPHHDPKPRVAVEAPNALFANVIFGHGKFAPGDMVIALLTVPPFSPESARGLLRVGLGQ